MGSHPPPYPLRHDPWGIPLSSSQVETDTGNLPDEPYHDRFAAQLASQSDRTLPPARRTVSSRTYPFGRRPSSRPPTERPSSPSSPFSDSGVPIRIQVLSLLDQPRYSSLHSKIRWEFTLHLLPSTKMYELCLHAASYILREYRVPVDGRDLVAQSMDGSLCEDQDSLSDESLQGQAVLLVERGLLSTGKSVPVKSRDSYPESLHVDWRPEAGKLDGSHTASIREPRPHATDEPDQVPPPRQLPFPSVATSSTSKPAARSPLSERPDLMNANAPARADKRSTQPASQTEAAAEKQPNQSQKRPTTISRRPVSSTSGSKLNSVTGAAESSKPQASARRPETSLGIRRKSKTCSGDEGVSMPPVIGSLTSDNGVRTEELATSSCIGCRNKKRKCDRSKPACGPCLKDKRHCKYPNIPKVAATGHMPEKACDRPVLDTAAHLMIRRSQALVPPTMVSDALTQTPHPREYRDVGSQTRGIEEENQDVAMKDLGKDSHKLYTDTSTQTDRSDDFWVPFSQCTEVVLWASNQYERQIQKAVEILRTTDPSRDDYREKLAQAAEYYLEYEEDLEEKLEEVLRR
ncbi:hypothetical protein F5883DRAFT_560070 [Diaporthe sp. PMI_573]|nr:hypothetical protein F5883DRAFT_560070 [Diaporthaceae sp. PMI_573]